MAFSSPRIGLFGGRFDPPHRGHLRMAQAAANQLGLDEVRWVVSGHPVHKSVQTSAHHRFEMVRRLLVSQPDTRQAVDDTELRMAEQGLETPTYQTLRHFARLHSLENAVWLIGQDQLSRLTTWRQWQEIARCVPLGVFSRSDSLHTDSLDTITAQLLELAPSLRVLPIHSPLDEANSTDIRQKLQRGDDVGDSIAAVVLEYALTHRLYAKRPEEAPPGT